MARRRVSSGPAISLFPFLSILACLIGALTLIIMALSLSALFMDRDEDVARAEEYVATRKRMEERRQEIERVEEELRQTNREAAELAALQTRKIDLETQVARAALVTARLKALDGEKRRIGDERGRLEKLLQPLEEELVAGQEKLGELARQLSRGTPLQVLPSSAYFRRVAPVFAEARKEGLVVHSPSRVVEIPRAAIGTHPDFRKVVDFVAAEEERILVLLVRGEGRSSFYAAQKFARQHGAVTSKVPLLGTGELDLKEFFRKR